MARNKKPMEMSNKMRMSANMGALRLLVRNIIPLLRPRFSKEEYSAKKAKQSGMPNPKEAPNKKPEAMGMLGRKRGKIDAMIPKIIHM